MLLALHHINLVLKTTHAIILLFKSRPYHCIITKVDLLLLKKREGFLPQLVVLDYCYDLLYIYYLMAGWYESIKCPVLFRLILQYHFYLNGTSNVTEKQCCWYPQNVPLDYKSWWFVNTYHYCWRRQYSVCLFPTFFQTGRQAAQRSSSKSVQTNRS